MPKQILFFLFFLFSLSLGAQSGVSLGGGIDYNVDVKRTGLFLRGSYDIDESWRGAGTFNFFLDGGSRTTQWELAADAHYFFWDDGVKMKSYLIGGINLFHRHRSIPVQDETTGSPLPSTSETTNHLGINLGAGIQTQISPRVTPFAEAKVTVGDGSLFGIYAGVIVRFKGS